MTNLFLAPTFLCAASQVAAIKAGHYGDGGDHVLLVTNNASVPEVSDTFADAPGFEVLAEYFREVRFLNEFISPHHPTSYKPDQVGRRLLRRDIEGEFGVESFETITADAVHGRPSRTLFRLFPEARITAISHNLTSYGPSPAELFPSVAKRVERLLYVELIPGLNPLLLSELGVAQFAITADSLRDVLSDAARGVDHAGAAVREEPLGLILGQDLAALGVLSAREEEDFTIEMLQAAAGRGVSTIVLKTHPAAPPASTTRLRAAAVKLGIQLEILTTPAPVELLLESLRPRFVLGSSSTGLSTARVLCGAHVLTWGAERLALRLPPADINRVPMVLSYLTLEHVNGTPGQRAADSADPVDLEAVVRALVRCIEPERHAQAISDREVSQIRSARADLEPFFGRAAGEDSPVRAREGEPVPPVRRGLVHRARVLSYRVQRALPPRLRQPVRNLRAKALSFK